MNLNELEKGLKNYKPGSQDKIDTEKLWGEVSPHIPQFKKRDSRRFLFLFFFLFATMMGLYLLNKNPKTTYQNLVVEPSTNSTIPNNKYLVDNKNNNTFDHIDESTTPTDKSFINKTKSTRVVQANNSTKSNETIVSNNSIVNVSASNSYTEVQLVNKKFEVANATPTKFNSINKYNAIKDQGRNSDLESTISDLKNTQMSSNTIDEATPLHASTFTPELNNSLKSSKLFVSKETQRRELIDLGVIPLASLLFAETKLPPAPKRFYVQNRHSHYKGSIDISGGYFIPSRSLTLENQEFENEFASRIASEELLEAWNGTITFRYMIHPNVGISAGLQYSEINERSTRRLSLTETILVEDTIIGNFIRLDGTDEPIFGDIELNRTTTRNVSRINTFRLVQIPIEVFYAHRINKLQLELGAGVIQNISTSSSGFWHPDDQSEYDLSLDQNDYLKSRIGMSFTGRAGISYPLNKSFDLFSNIRYVTSIDGFTNSNYGINQSYSLFGVDLGIRINLFK